MGIIEVRHLTLELGGKKILDELSVDFWSGQIHAVVGPNGAGKSTFAYTLMGLSGYRDYQGEIEFEGRPLKELSINQRAQRGMTLAWQEPARFEGLSVEKFIYASARKKDPQIVEDVLFRMGLDPGIYARRAVDKTLSGGERKKIEMASILAMKPAFVMLDEPDSGIDVASLDNIFAALRYLKEQGSTVVLITHSLAVLKQAEHAFLFCGGKIMDKGRIERVQRYFEGKCMPCNHQNIPAEEDEEVGS